MTPPARHLIPGLSTAGPTVAAVADWLEYDGGNAVRAEADARLMAAAPELAACLRALLEPTAGLLVALRDERVCRARLRARRVLAAVDGES